MKRQWLWIAVFAALAAGCAAWLLLIPHGGTLVGVYQNGELVATIDPSAAADDYELILTYADGESVVRVGPDGVYIASADCKSQDCVRHGPLTENGTPIVCLPERIVIRWISGGGDELDAVSG